MEAIRILIEEHRIIDQVLDALEKAVLLLQLGKHVDPVFFTDAAEFINVFSDTCHMKKEENVLFNALWNAGLYDSCGPIGMNVMGHEVCRAHALEFTRAAAALQAGRREAAKELADSAFLYISAARHHQKDEERCLYTCAERVLPQSLDPEMLKEFAAIDRVVLGDGQREKYLGKAYHITHKRLAIV